MTAADGLPGIGTRRAPDWEVEAWRRLPDGYRTMELDRLSDRLVWLFCFQSWCPGCHSIGFPAFRSLIERFGANQRIAFVAVQTVFEGFEQNTLEAGLRSVDEFDLTVPVGHTVASGPGAVPPLMASYRNGGTPWNVLIGPDRVVRAEGFHLPVDVLSQTIERLLPSARARTS